jgi:hypothetical protein
MEPVLPVIPDNIGLVFEYLCEFDYTKSSYLGKSLTDNKRVELYNLKDKVENLHLMSGASVTLEKITISDKIQIDVLDGLSNSVNAAINEKLNLKLSEYKNFNTYCKEQMYYSKIDPVITENTIRNGKLKGVYNTVDSYDAEGGVLNQLNKLSNLSGTLTYPKTERPLRYYTCGRNTGKIGETYNQLYVTLGYDSKLTIDCSNYYYDISSQ